MNKHDNKKITYRHLYRLLTSQDYFVWNTSVSEKVFDNVNNDEEIDEQLFWDISLDYEIDELENYKYVDVIKNSFGHVKELLVKQILEEAKARDLRVAIVSDIKTESAFKKTFELMQDPKVDWIINPVFVSEDLVSRPILFNKENNSCSALIYGSRLKLKNYIQAYFDQNVLRKLDIEINDYFFYYFDSLKDYEKPNDLSFKSTNYCWTSLTGGDPEKMSSISEKEHETIITKLNSGIIKNTQAKKTKDGRSKKIDEERTNARNVNISLDKNDFDLYVSMIRKAKEVTTMSPIGIRDKTVWGTNEFFSNFFDFEAHGLKRVSGNLLNKNDLIDISLGTKKVDDFFANKRTLELVHRQTNVFDFEKINEVVSLIENAKVLWFDFEGFSMPYAMLPHTKPYQQLIFQLSLIVTDRERIIEVNNDVYDPKKISVDCFKNIIDSIWREDIDHYVVYNKSYEHSKLIDMVNLIKRDNISEKNITEEYSRKVDDIILKTIDLNDFFKITSNKVAVPPIFLHELLGFSSIKRIEKLITKKDLDLEVMITPYKDLEVQNGLMAMNKAIQRYIGSYGDLEWNSEIDKLKKYCENDVRAMIMVYFFIKHLIKNEKNNEI